METQNSSPSPAAAAAAADTITTTTAEDAATNNGGNATQEVSSTTQAVEPTKRSLRVQIWKKLQENKLGIRFGAIFNRIPSFMDADKAATLLADTDEFKKAKEIKVQIDGALNGAKMQTILAGKNLYLPSTRNSKALYLKVEVPADVGEEKILEVLKTQNIEKDRIEIALENKVALDMIVIGSVVVSRDGYRIGRGNGFNDLDIGLLTEVGSITPNTVIVTLVHDAQVVDNLPTNLFQKYDSPVDMIVTPTEVIRVAKRLPRPTGLFWELLSERRLKIVPVLEALKETQEKEGKVIVLKEEDTDVEQNKQQYRNRRRFRTNRRFGGRRFQRRTVSQTNADQQGDNEQPQNRNTSRRRRFTNRRRRPTKSEGDQSGVESKSQDRKSGDGANRKQKFQRKTQKRTFSIKLTNITREVRIKDLKNELRNRECNPLAITWKGNYGRCFLHFGNRNGEPSTEEEMNKVLEALNDLSLTITPEENNNSNEAEGATNGGEGAGEATGVGAGEGVGDRQDPPAAAGETAGVVAGEGVGDQQDPAAAAAAAKTPKVINLKVELIKYADKAKKAAGTATDAPAATTVNGGDAAASGDATSARIESVDTTTV